MTIGDKCAGLRYWLGFSHFLMPCRRCAQDGKCKLSRYMQRQTTIIPVRDPKSEHVLFVCTLFGASEPPLRSRHMVNISRNRLFVAHDHYYMPHGANCHHYLHWCNSKVPARWNCRNSLFLQSGCRRPALRRGHRLQRREMIIVPTTLRSFDMLPALDVPFRVTFVGRVQQKGLMSEPEGLKARTRVV